MAKQMTKTEEAAAIRNQWHAKWQAETDPGRKAQAWQYYQIWYKATLKMAREGK